MLYNQYNQEQPNNTLSESEFPPTLPLKTSPHDIKNKSIETCKHCGQKLLSGKNIATGFCCMGCKAAFNLIHKLGLSYYYCLKGKADKSQSPAGLQNSTFAYYNDENFKKDYVAKDEKSGLSSIDLNLRGLNCTACVWIIEKLKDVVPGLVNVRVNILENKCKLLFDETLITPGDAVSVITGLGYEASPIPLQDEGILTGELRDSTPLNLYLGVAAFSAMNVMLLFIAKYQGYFSGIESGFDALFAWTSLLLTIPAVVYAARPFYLSSISGLKFGRLHIDLPISFAIIAGFIASCVNTILSKPEIYFDTVTALIFLLLLGRWLQRKALLKAAFHTSLLHSLSPLSARKVICDGKVEEVYSGSLKQGDKILIAQSESFPVDGKIIKGQSWVNNSILTGESTLVKVIIGSQIWAGTRNEGDDLIVEVENTTSSSRLGKLLSEIQKTAQTESKTARFIDKISIYFVTAVILISVITFLAFIPQGFWTAWDRVIALLVVSCPCALGIATPITLALASGSAAKKGVLLRGANALEHLAGVKKILFDKTGTLTNGNPGLKDAEIFDKDFTWQTIWQIVFAMEEGETHPFGQKLFQIAKNECKKACDLMQKTSIRGRGVKATGFNSHIFRLGSIEWLSSERVSISKVAERFYQSSLANGDTCIALACDENLTAIFRFTDTLRNEACNAVSLLKKRGIELGILSGDSQAIVNDIAQKSGIAGTTLGGLSPEDKAEVIKDLEDPCAFVGDGVNDALALKAATVGVGISGGAEICFQTADIYLARQDLSLLVTAVDGARQTLRLIHRHLLISLFYNIIAVSLAICGLIGPLTAAFVMPASSLTVIASSLLAAPFREKKT